MNKSLNKAESDDISFTVPNVFYPNNENQKVEYCDNRKSEYSNKQCLSHFKVINNAYFNSGIHSSKQTTGIKKLLNDSQEFTVCNFNWDSIRVDSIPEWKPKVKKIPQPKDVSLPSPSSIFSNYESILISKNNDIK